MRRRHIPPLTPLSKATLDRERQGKGVRELCQQNSLTGSLEVVQINLANKILFLQIIITLVVVMIIIIGSSLSCGLLCYGLFSMMRSYHVHTGCLFYFFSPNIEI